MTSSTMPDKVRKRPYQAPLLLKESNGAVRAGKPLVHATEGSNFTSTPGGHPVHTPQGPAS
jgi:hypothetical protein